MPEHFQKEAIVERSVRKQVKDSRLKGPFIILRGT
jgi:hypothetical protein